MLCKNLYSSLNIRLKHSLHRKCIRESKQFEVTSHINNCGRGQFKTMFIYKMKNEQEVTRKTRN